MRLHGLEVMIKLVNLSPKRRDTVYDGAGQRENDLVFDARRIGVLFFDLAVLWDESRRRKKYTRRCSVTSSILHNHQ